jgi:hypothetical protein
MEATITGTENDDGELATTPCRYCLTPMTDGAAFCTACNKFQSPWQRFTDGITISVLLSALPLIAIVFVFVQDRIVFPHSDIHVVVLRCEADFVRLAFNNAGTRAGIVASGRLAVFESEKVIAERDMLPSEGSPIVLDRGKTALARFELGSIDGVQVGGLGDIIGGRSCRYVMDLSAFEFGNEDRTQEKVSCSCPR